MQRVVYTPEAFVYIYTSDGQFLDLSPDIISGTVNRVVNDLSTVSFQLQNNPRDTKDGRYTSKYLGGQIRPMDRITVFLKKVKPIQVFSGFVDLCSYWQPYPRPINLQASCTLKRLEFTYWDPGLLQVQAALDKLGFTYMLPGQSGSGSGNLFLTSGTQAGSKPGATSNAEFTDTGFSALLRWLIGEVGQWTASSIHIEDIPMGWIKRAISIYQNVLVDTEQNEKYLEAFMQGIFNSAANSSDNAAAGGAASAGTGGSTGTVYSGNIENRIISYLKGKGVPDSRAQAFAQAADAAGKTNNLDPFLLIAISGAESSFGVTLDGSYNPLGLLTTAGPGMSFSSFAAAFSYAASDLRNNYADLLAKGTTYAISTRWCPVGAANDPTGLNAQWPTNVATFYGGLLNQKWTTTTVSPDKFAYPQQTGAKSQTVKTTPVMSPTATLASGPGLNSGAVAAPGDALVQIQGGFLGPTEPGRENEVQNEAAGASVVLVGNHNGDLVTTLKTEINGISKNAQFVDKAGSMPSAQKMGAYIIIYESNIFDSTKPLKGYSAAITYPNYIHTSQFVQSGNITSQFPKPVVATPGLDTDLTKQSQTLAANLLAYNPNTSIGYGGQIPYLAKPIYDGGVHTGVLSDYFTNHYSFYYSGAGADMVILVPPPPDRDGPLNLTQYNHLLHSISYAITDYLISIASPKTTSPVTTPTAAAAVSPAQTKTNNFLNIIKAYALAHGPTAPAKDRVPYVYGQGHTGVPLSDPSLIKSGMDCSAFISDGMIQAGILKKGASYNTTSFAAASKVIVQPTNDKPSTFEKKLTPGNLLITSNGGGGIGHIVCYIGNTSICQCSAGGAAGPNIADMDSNGGGYGAYEFNGTGGGDAVTGASPANNTLVDANTDAISSAFNIQFSWPVNELLSQTLTGYRSFENDVKLFESVSEICQASFRVFSSLPDGSFIAWYPDYFNLSGNDPWFVIQSTEILDLTIDLSDASLTTHVYVTGNQFAAGAAPIDATQQTMEDLFGAGVVTIDMPGILNTFLTTDPVNDAPTVSQTAISVLETANSVYPFLNKYGVRPYVANEPTIRHPMIEFFMAYHRFMYQWANQFISNISLTFQPELFPGMIVEFNIPDLASGPTSFCAYVEGLTHTFDYTNGFTTDVQVSSLSYNNVPNDNRLPPSLTLLAGNLISVAAATPAKAPKKVVTTPKKTAKAK